MGYHHSRMARNHVFGNRNRSYLGSIFGPSVFTAAIDVRVHVNRRGTNHHSLSLPPFPIPFSCIKPSGPVATVVVTCYHNLAIGTLLRVFDFLANIKCLWSGTSCSIAVFVTLLWLPLANVHNRPIRLTGVPPFAGLPLARTCL